MKRMKVISMKLEESDFKEIAKLAKKFAKGNISAWIRHAATRYSPKAKEAVEAKRPPK